MADSFAFAEAITGAMVVQLINNNLGQTDWQNATQGGSGITLAQALAAFMIDETPIDTHRLDVDRSNPTQITIGLTHTGAGDQRRYAAPSADNMFSESEWLAGMTSMNDMIRFPSTSAQHYKGFAVPTGHASLTSIQQVGNPFDERGSFLPALGDSDVLANIGGESHKIYIGQAPDFGGFAVDYVLR